MVFNATFNNISAISWQSDLLVEETDVLVCSYISIDIIPSESIVLCPEMLFWFQKSNG
jgi:hypothetical protein